MSAVSNYIQQQDDEDFVGSWMMIGNFKEAPHDGSTENRVNCFLLCVHSIYVINFCRQAIFKELSSQMGISHMLCSHICVALCQAMEISPMELLDSILMEVTSETIHGVEHQDLLK